MQSVRTTVRRVREKLFGKEVARLMSVGDKAYLVAIDRFEEVG